MSHSIPEGNKVLFITGAGSGMGQLAARNALEAGWKVAALDLNAEGLDALGESEQLLKLTVDISDAAQVQAAADQTERELGPIFRVVNAAAIMPLGLALDQSVELADKIMSINYMGLVHVVHATLPRMLQRGEGEFVSFASMAGLVPTIYVAAYDASKFAVTAYTEVLAQENHGRGVKFCCVCPPMVATPLLNQARETTWPKLFDFGRAITPQKVLDDVEKALSKNRFWVLPSFEAKLLGWTRRFAPRFLSWLIRVIEHKGLKQKRTGELQLDK